MRQLVPKMDTPDVQIASATARRGFLFLSKFRVAAGDGYRSRHCRSFRGYNG